MTRSKNTSVARGWAAACGAAVLVLLWAIPAPQAQEGGSKPAVVDFEFFKNNVQPIFLTKRAGNARCVSCHIEGTPMRLQPLSPGATTWNEEQSRKNFELVRTRIVPGNPMISRLLIHPLATEGGGDLYHSGGKHWKSQDDPEWQTLAAWVRGRTAGQAAPTATSASGKVRILQTNSAGDNVHIIDPVTNKVVGEITGIEVGHGAVGSPDGRWIYVSNEAESTLDFVDARTLRVMSKVPLSGHPNNLAIGKDGRKVYVSVRSEPGGVDVIDTASKRLAKTVRTKAGIHNTYVTPDGRYAVAGSIPGEDITVIDTATDQIAWVLQMDLGIRPMAFDQNPDGSTRYIFAQLSELNGFAVVDFAARKEVRRIKHPEVAANKQVKVGGNVSHGMAVTPDSRILIVNSRLNNAVYKYSLPDLKVIGAVEMTGGIDPNWVTLTPDGRTAYVAMSGSNWVSAVDIASMKETARISVGQVPKRNSTARLQ